MDDNSPHALIAFLDGEKESVPLSFIYQFPPDWRTNKWDPNYLFKVFWSPDDEDSPSNMLKRVAKIPVYEQGSSLEKAGYYRGAVVVVEDTLKDLEMKLDAKRPSCGLLKFKYTSFDKGSSSSSQTAESSSTSRSSRGKRNTTSQPSDKPMKPPVLKKKRQIPKGTQKKGICSAAQSRNTEGLRDDLQRRYPHLFTTNASMEESEYVNSLSDSDNNRGKSMSSNKGDEKNSEDCVLDDDKDVDISEYVEVGLVETDTPIEVDAVKEPCNSTKQHKINSNIKSENSNIKDSSNSGDGESKDGKRKKDALSSEDEQSSSSEAEIKKMKLDPDYTPRKYEAAKVELALKKSTINRITDLNLKLQEKNIKLEARIEVLEEENTTLKCLVQKLSCKKTEISTDTTSKGSSVPSSHGKKKESLPSVSSGTAKRFLSFSSKNGSAKEPSEPKSSESGKHSSTSPGEDSPPAKEHAGDISEAELSTDIGEKPATGNSPDDAKVGCDLIETDDETDDKPFKLCENVTITPEIKKLIFDISDKEKKDIKFIKDLALVAFGPEVLASHSIKGTLKGRKKKDESREKKEALDSTVLDAVRTELIKRVAKAENIPMDQAKEHTRCSATRYHSAIRDLQKRCRSLGFGDGTKPNTVDPALLMTN